jgi:excisionase family DNA binding protein
MATIPFEQRVTCTVRDACQATGFSKSTMFEWVSDGTVQSKKVGGKRLIYVPSLLKVVKPEQTAA